MFSNFVVAVSAVIPIFVLIGIGLFVKHAKLMTPEELKHTHRMVFRVFFFCMMFANIYRADFDDGFPEKRLHKLYQDGKEVYKFATKALPKAFHRAADKAGITPEDIDWFVPHQANVRIIKTAAKNLGAPMEKFIVTLDHYGNTSSVSIHLALHESIEKGIIRRGQKLALIGFGAGLTYAGAIFEY